MSTEGVASAPEVPFGDAWCSLHMSSSRTHGLANDYVNECR
jgi:hypothetical protein